MAVSDGKKEEKKIQGGVSPVLFWVWNSLTQNLVKYKRWSPDGAQLEPSKILQNTTNCFRKRTDPGCETQKFRHFGIVTCLRISNQDESKRGLEVHLPQMDSVDVDEFKPTPAAFLLLSRSSTWWVRGQRQQFSRLGLLTLPLKLYKRNESGV